MAHGGAAQEASSSSTRCRFNYQLFLSFRGTDTRKTFTDHLYTALDRAGIRTFIDNNDLKRGENINFELPKAIRESRASIVVFSTDYASSRWCLDEVTEILDRKRSVGHVIFPVFYDVNPSEVRSQSGSFAEAFEKHEERFKGRGDEIEKEWMERVRKWRATLREIADLGGMVFQDQIDGQESLFIQEIVKNIQAKLKRIVLNVPRHPVGIDFRSKKINLWLQDSSTDVVVGVICGMGGIGKTTIAKTVYNLNFERFESSSFLANIRQMLEQHNGFLRLQRQLLLNISKGRQKEKIYNLDQGITKIKNAISCKKVLVVLDDVDEEEHLNVVFGMRDWFCHGSKILITTRNERLLKAHEVYKMFKITTLDDHESLKLFSWHAFGQDHPSEGYKELSQSAVRHCSGVPLALQVFGSSLSGTSVDVWRNALEKLEVFPENKVQKTLEISYAALEDDHDKNLFLHIACFFVGKKKDFVVKILDECNFYTIVGIENLLDRFLITTDESSKLMVHQLLQEMGREIIRQESPEPGKRSRLWHHKDSFYVLKEKTGTGNIEGFVLNMHTLKEDKSFQKIHHVKRRFGDAKLVESSKRRRLEILNWHPIANAVSRLFPMPNKAELNADSFTGMHNLSLLKLNHVEIGGDYKEFPKNLKWLCWHGFSLNCVPDDLPMESLVALEMQYSSLEQVWKGSKFLKSLKILNLSHSHGLIRTPNWSGLPNLEKLMLKYCTSLVKVHESIGDLKTLAFLNLKGCKNLTELPKKVGHMKSLKKLILSGCTKLKWVSTELEKLGSLTVLHANWTSISKLNSIAKKQDDQWTKFIQYWTSRPSKSSDFSLASLPRNLTKLSLAGCNISDNAIPKDLSGLSLLWYLDLSLNPISSLPESIKGLTMLNSLWLDTCTELQSLPDLPLSLKEFVVSNCKSLKKMTVLPELLRSLDIKSLDGCDKLVNIDGLYRLEPLVNFDKRMINNLVRVDLESMENIEVEMCNGLLLTRNKGPIQGLHEFGIFSTFLPGSNVPDQFTNKTKGSSISFTVPPPQHNLEIQGLNVCVVYSPSKYHKHSNFHNFYLEITNKTKGVQWNYEPTCYGDGDMVWLSHWKITDQIEAGDEVNVSMVMGYGFQVLECGSYLVYGEEQASKELIEPNLFIRDKNVFHGDLSAYQRGGRSYFLGYCDFYPDLRPPEKEPPSDRWDDPNVYDPSYWQPVYKSDEEEIESGNDNEEEEDDVDDF